MPCWPVSLTTVILYQFLVTKKPHLFGCGFVVFNVKKFSDAVPNV